jgi:hypothetical protein
MSDQDAAAIIYDYVIHNNIDSSRNVGTLAIEALEKAGLRVIEDQPDHIVEFTEDRWAIQHSVDCRIKGQLLDCEINRAVTHDTSRGRPEWISKLGRYKVSIDAESGDAFYERIEDNAVG